ncbi:kinase-like domain-containing protein [Rhizophagus diaphanus]|nr:kinase-like domain-containing protein [Rhizophagus diaphanus] [Rhizophagus sp. MUCL 43196]
MIYGRNRKKKRSIGECNEPSTGSHWCQPCNAKRFKENFNNWTSNNKDHIDELIQHSQLNAVQYKTCLEWIPYEKFQNVTYITRGGFGKIYSAEWPEGCICHWDIENQKWYRSTGQKVALKSLDNSSEISTDFLNEIKSYLHIYIWNIVYCYGITQDPNTKDYMMVSYYCRNGNLRNFYDSDTNLKLNRLLSIANVLFSIHNAEKVHKDFHSGNILDDVEIPFNDIPHDHILDVKICKGLRPKISEDIPKFLMDLIMKCWDAKTENRPTAKEFRLLNFKNLPGPVNSSDLSSFKVNSDYIPSVSENLISECFDVQFSESDDDNLNDES